MRSDCEQVPKPFTKADADKAEVMEAQLVTAQSSRATAAATAGCQVYWPAPYQVCGAIKDKYNQLGGPNSFLLFPKSNELTNPGNTGKRTEFLGGNIYWSTATGARPVAHDFLTKWGELGYESGFMKYPTTDEIVLSNGGRRQEFQGGSIYFSFDTGAHAIYGLIRDRWRSLGAENSYLGYPTSDEQQTTRYSQLGARQNVFQAGRVIANLSNNTTQYLGYYASRPPSQARATSAQDAGEPLRASDIPPVGQQPVADGCPDDSTYPDRPEFSCKWADEDLNGQFFWARVGVARGTTIRNDSGDAISNGFGLKHLKDDHNITSRAAHLMLRQSPFCRPIFQKSWGDKYDRCEYGTKVQAMPSGLVTEEIITVMQTSIDDTGASKDNAQMGLITGFCRVGTDGSLKQGYCDDEWMGPYGNFDEPK